MLILTVSLVNWPLLALDLLRENKNEEKRCLTFRFPVRLQLQFTIRKMHPSKIEEKLTTCGSQDDSRGHNKTLQFIQTIEQYVSIRYNFDANTFFINFRRRVSCFPRENRFHGINKSNKNRQLIIWQTTQMWYVDDTMTRWQCPCTTFCAICRFSHAAIK